MALILIKAKYSGIIVILSESKQSEQGSLNGLELRGIIIYRQGEEKGLDMDQDIGSIRKRNCRGRGVLRGEIERMLQTET